MRVLHRDVKFDFSGKRKGNLQIYINGRFYTRDA